MLSTPKATRKPRRARARRVSFVLFAPPRREVSLFGCESSSRSPCEPATFSVNPGRCHNHAWISSNDFPLHGEDHAELRFPAHHPGKRFIHFFQRIFFNQGLHT